MPRPAVRRRICLSTCFPIPSARKKQGTRNKYYDDLLKQNSMIYLGWDVYRWAVRQMQQQPDTVKDELRVFLGSSPHFREVEDYLPCQRSKAIEADNLELKEHQKDALASLEEMRRRHETIALIYHATGTGKTVTAVTDAKRIGKRTLFIAHTNELVTQAAETFKRLWTDVSVGIYMGPLKEKDAFVVCGSVQSVALHTEEFGETDFEYLIIDEAHHAAAETYQKILSYFKPSFTLKIPRISSISRRRWKSASLCPFVVSEYIPTLI